MLGLLAFLARRGSVVGLVSGTALLTAGWGFLVYRAFLAHERPTGHMLHTITAATTVVLVLLLKGISAARESANMRD